MAADTKIAWATSTFNPWLGCTKVASGCTNCYAADMAGRLGVKWGPNGTRRRTAESTWKQVERWNRQAACIHPVLCGDEKHPYGHCSQHEGSRHRVFPSLCDIFEDLPLVEWKEFSKGYRVSIYGEIQSRWRRGGGLVDEWQTLHPRVGERGYSYFNARGDENATLKVHQVVLKAFVGDCPAGMVARHWDGNRQNNCLWNLQYGTQKENQEDMLRHGTSRTGERNGRSKLSESDIQEIKNAYDSGESQSSIAGRYAVGQAAISKVVRGVSWVTREPFEASDCVRNHSVGHILDSRGRPLFHENLGYSVEPNEIATESWNPLTMADIRRDFFAMIDRCQNLDFLLLTKRPENIRRMWPAWIHIDGTRDSGASEFYRHNVWLLYSASDQASLDTGLPHLLACRDLSPVLGLSLEPLLGPIDLSAYIGYNPVHETNIRNRDVRLSSSSERRPGDSEGRISLANCAGTRKPMEQEDIVASDSSTSSGRNHVGRIPASQSHARQQTGNDRGASTGLSALPWTDSTWSDGQPQERDQTRQSSRQPGTSDIRGAGSSREEDARAQVENRQPERRGKRHGEANGGSSSGNSPETFGRGVAEVDSRGLRNLGSNGVQDSPWGSVGARPFVIVGGESGPKHRPMEISWLESIADQCAAAGVPLFVKQDCGRKPGQQGQIPDDLWTRKEFPKP